MDHRKQNRAAQLKYPGKMLAPDQPFAMPVKTPLVLKINDRLTIKCVAIPPGKFLMGTPSYMWPNYVEEYPHLVTLTKPFYLAEVPVTQEIYDAILGASATPAESPGSKESRPKDPQLPTLNPPFADIEKFCQALSERSGRKVRLPTDAEWEYAARVGTSNPGFAAKYNDQNSSGPDGFKTTLKVRSKKPNAWGLYDMASSWWEITADKGMYNVRHPEVDPRYPPTGPDISKIQRSGRGILKDNWSIGTHEFIGEKGYAGQKFRVLVEDDGAADGLGRSKDAPRVRSTLEAPGNPKWGAATVTDCRKTLENRIPTCLIAQKCRFSWGISSFSTVW